MGSVNIVDYIVLGGGSSGCVLAGRLSLDGERSVLLVEAGQDARKLLNRMPAGSMKLLPDPQFNWQYGTEPDPSINGRKSAWSAGRILGGGSAINGTVYTRGARHDYDGWAAAGCIGWSWADVLPYFLRSEDFQGSESPSHARGGPLPVSPLRSPHPLAGAFLRACAEAGFRDVPDYCSGDVDGAFLNFVTQRRGERWSSARAFIESADGRPNLTVLCGALADRVLIEGKRAVGARLIVDGEPREYRVRREVIVSAGSIGTPAILMRSGIGPGKHLQAMGIPVVHDAPEVGRNLQEHPCYPYSRFVDISTYNMKTHPASIMAELAKYLLFRRGMMTAAPVQAMAFLRSRAELPFPDVKLAFCPMAFDLAGRGMHQKPGVTVQVIASSPKSRGEVRLRSPKAEDRPVIDHRLLDHPDDIASMIGGIRHIERIFAAPSLARHVAGRNTPADLPEDAAGWETQIRLFSGNGYQPVGSCRMGADNDAVVDPELRLCGVAGVRVADVSVLPTMPTGNTNAPAIMIGEKAADLIRRHG
jgi:choline dehydrogenase